MSNVLFRACNNLTTPKTNAFFISKIENKMEEVNVKFQKIDIDYVLSILSMFCDDKQEQIDNSAISAHFKYELERCSKIIKEIESQKVEQ